MGWQDAPVKNAWEAAPAIKPGIDPQTNAPYDPSIPTNMALANARASGPYKPTFTEKLGNLWEASKLEGLAPEVYPIGGLTKTPMVEKGKVAAETIASDIKGSETAQKLANALSKSGKFVSSIPNKILGLESGKNPEAFNTIYQAYKQDIPEIKQAISEATPLGKQLYKDAIYNYARAYNLPHDVALLAEDYTRNHPQGLGAWDLIDKQYKLYPNALNAAEARATAAKNVYRPFEELSDAEKLKQATQAGVDTSVWNPIPPKTGKNDLYNIALGLGKKAILPSIFQVTAPLSSPKLSRYAAILAGKTANVAGKAGEKVTELVNMLPEASLENIINTAIITNKANKEQQ